MTPSAVAIRAIRTYQRFVSPWLPPRCRYWPTCSEYAGVAIERRGVVLGSVAALGRLLRCRPLGGSGIDLPR